MKRLFDLALSIPAFFFLSFFMLIIAILVRFKIGSPVIFRQVRPLLMQYLDRYTPEQARRHEVKRLL